MVVTLCYDEVWEVHGAITNPTFYACDTHYAITYILIFYETLYTVLLLLYALNCYKNDRILKDKESRLKLVYVIVFITLLLLVKLVIED